MWLSKYSGDWNEETVDFFLSRTTYGKNKALVQQVLTLGLDSAMDELFSAGDPIGLPLNYRDEEDPQVPIGDTWIGSLPQEGLTRNQRHRAINCWNLGNIMSGGLSVREKLTMFWHNHFAVASVNLPEFKYEYLELIRRESYGNFRTLVEEMTLSAAMLVFLNGNQNRAASPNENYARELLELFTIGRGPNVGGGDYTYYTEQDVVELAKALTGWRQGISDTGEVAAFFRANQHDSTDKQLSHRFDNAVISDQGEEEYKTVVNLILQKPEVARYIVRQLHIWFVGAEISEEVEANVIVPLATQFLADDYELEGMLRTLFSSDYFFEHSHRGCMIASPIEFLSKVVNVLEVPMPERLVDRYYVWIRLYFMSRDMGQRVLDCPTVAGWKAYYQAPLYYRNWINSVALIEREDAISRAFSGLGTEGVFARIDTLAIVANLRDPYDINSLVDELVTMLFAIPIGEEQKAYLKDILIPGLPDFEWSVEYSLYQADPTNAELSTGIARKVENLLKAMMSMAEFHLL